MQWVSGWRGYGNNDGDREEEGRHRRAFSERERVGIRQQRSRTPAHRLLHRGALSYRSYALPYILSNMDHRPIHLSTGEGKIINFSLYQKRMTKEVLFFEIIISSWKDTFVYHSPHNNRTNRSHPHRTTKIFQWREMKNTSKINARHRVEQNK